MGGPSTEREVSFKSGMAVYEHLKCLNLDVVAIDIKSDDKTQNAEILKKHSLDCAFIALHGSFGEDGGIQEVLESLSLPYTGSGVPASRLAMDKIASRKIFEEEGIFMPKAYLIIDRDSFDRDKLKYKELKYPLVVKPACAGSSIGLSVVSFPQDLISSIERAFAVDNRVVLEEFIQGRELTVGILDDKPLPVIEIKYQGEIFDYESKYKSSTTQYIIPALLDENTFWKAQEQAVKAHRLLGCFGCSRVDMMLGGDNIPYILEVNAIPGMTSTSLLPKAAKFIGVDFSQLCLRLIELAYKRNVCQSL